MNSEVSTLGVSAILCADWGKETRKRAVYVADVAAREVRRLDASGWSVSAVLSEADRLASRGPVLATLDAPLGIPESYLAAAVRVPSWRSPTTFLEFLTQAHCSPNFFEGTSVAADWKIEQPFFSVPVGEGGLKSYHNAAAQQGVDLYRAIDKRTGAKTLFAKSGIPGSVGSATCALWKELGPLLEMSRTFRVWPFEGALQALLESSPVVVGEIYPRAAYATALLDAPRPPLVLAKTHADVRRKAIADLLAADWVRLNEVTIKIDANANEDDFDACLTAAALLRCVVEKLPLCLPRLNSARAEGGMLGTGSVNFDLRSGRRSGKRTRQGASAVIVRYSTKTFRCPIAGCDKVYVNARAGWDGHVGSGRSHPLWHPELTSAEERKRRFEIEFPEFFG